MGKKIVTMNTLKLSEEQLMLVELTPTNIQKSALPNSVKVVLGNLYFLNGTDYAKDNGCVYRSNADMMNDCQISKPTLITAVRQLDILGFIERDKGKRTFAENGKSQASVYRLKKDIVESYKIVEKMKKNKNKGLSLKNETLPPNFTTNEAIKLLVNELVEIKNELKDIRLSLNGLSLKNETLPPNFTHTENQLVTTMGKVSTSGKDCSNFTTDTDIEPDTSIVTSASNEDEENKKSNYVSNDSLAFPCAGACEENAGTNISGLNSVDDDNVKPSYDESQHTNSFFSSSQESLSATEITTSNEGGENNPSADNTENASGDAGEALDSSVVSHTIPNVISQPERPEGVNQPRPDKTATDRILKILKGRDIYTYVGDFRTWVSTADDVSPEMIDKIERDMTFINENGMFRPAQWTMIKSLILNLRNKRGSTYKGGGAPDKVDFNILREYIGNVYKAKSKSQAIDAHQKYCDTLAEYLDEELSENQRKALASIQDDMIKACFAVRGGLGCEDKELRYDYHTEPEDVSLDRCWGVLYSNNKLCRARFKELYKEKYGSYDGSYEHFSKLAQKKYGDTWEYSEVGMLYNHWYD